MDINKEIKQAFLYYQSGDLKKSEEICKKILKSQPQNIHIMHFLGIIYYQLQEYDSAIDYLKRITHKNSANHEVYYNLGRAFQKKGQNKEAIDCYQKATKIKKDFIDAYLNLGNLLKEEGLYNEAIKSYQKVVEINPQFSGAYYNIGSLFQEIDQIDEAVLAYQKAIELNPYYVDAYHDLGYVLQTKGEIEDAIRCYKKALQLDPQLYDAYNNLGRAFQEQGKIDEAISYYQKAIQLNPDFAEAHFNLSLALLLIGNFKDGWQEYEWRLKLREHSRYEFSKPLLKGSEIKDKKIFLYAEQGFGDTIQFIRYVELVAKRGARVIIVECQKELISLVREIKEIDYLLTREDPLPEFDFHYPLLSLPLIFETTLENIPSKVPYIFVNDTILKKWKERINKENSKFKIGLVWSGNPKYKKDMKRSIKLDILLPLLRIKGVTFFSLQKGEATNQIKDLPEEIKLIDYASEIEDFTDTASIIQNLDLVISVDTAVAHLAGALGRPVWTLLPFVPDWRWMLDREDSPWYPTMRLFRQPSIGDWKSVIERVKDELKKLIGNCEDDSPK